MEFGDDEEETRSTMLSFSVDDEEETQKERIVRLEYEIRRLAWLVEVGHLKEPEDMLQELELLMDELDIEPPDGIHPEFPDVI